jgi:glycosyltransferase involved in cell wall biosynthesis
MSKLSVCFISFEFPPFYWTGGEGIYSAGLCKALLKQGHRVTVLTANMNKCFSHNTEKPHIVFIDTINRTPFRLLSFYARAKAKIQELRQKESFDVVHYTTSYCVPMCPVLSREEVEAPVLATMHHPYPDERRIYTYATIKFGVKYSTWFLKALFKDLSARNTCKKVTKIIAVSRFTAENIINEYGVLPSKVAVIPNAVDANRFNPNVDGRHLRKKWQFHSDPLVIYVGRLAPTKGLNYLIEAFANVHRDFPDAKLILIGDGTMKSELMKMSRKLNLESAIKFAGRVSDDDLPRIYAAADLVVLPSLIEGCGLVLLEAMATSKPCVATTVGGIPEVVVNGETGILVPPRDSSALYKAICMILEDRSLSRKFGDAGRRRVEKRFTWDIAANQTTALYEQMLEAS